MCPTVFMEVVDPDINIKQHPALRLGDGETTNIFTQLYIPQNFNALTSVHVFIVGAGTGNMVAEVFTSWGQVCTEAYDAHTSGLASDVYALIRDDIICIDITNAFVGISAGDLVGIVFARFGGNVSDSIDDSCYYLGLRMIYT